MALALGRAAPQPRRAHPMSAPGGVPAPADHSPHNGRHAPGTGSRPVRTSAARTPTGHAYRHQQCARRSLDMPAATVRRVPDRPDPAPPDRTVSRTLSRPCGPVSSDPASGRLSRTVPPDASRPAAPLRAASSTARPGQPTPRSARPVPPTSPPARRSAQYRYQPQHRSTTESRGEWWTR